MTASADSINQVSGGRRGLDIELSPAELIRLTEAQTARIGTGRN